MKVHDSNRIVTQIGILKLYLLISFYRLGDIRKIKNNWWVLCGPRISGLNTTKQGNLQLLYEFFKTET